MEPGARNNPENVFVIVWILLMEPEGYPAAPALGYQQG
jgi:hypothetical protein